MFGTKFIITENRQRKHWVLYYWDKDMAKTDNWINYIYFVYTLKYTQKL